MARKSGQKPIFENKSGQRIFVKNVKKGSKLGKKGRFWAIFGCFWAFFEQFLSSWPNAHFFSLFNTKKF